MKGSDIYAAPHFDRTERGGIITISTGQLLCGVEPAAKPLGFPTAYLQDAIDQAQAALEAVPGVVAGMVTLTLTVEPFRNPEWSKAEP